MQLTGRVSWRGGGGQVRGEKRNLSFQLTWEGAVQQENKASTNKEKESKGGQILSAL